MLAMEKPSRYGRTTNSNSFRQRRSGYEPSDTETEWHEWQESPWHDVKNDVCPRDEAFMADRPRTPPTRNVSPMSRSKRYSSNHDNTIAGVRPSKTSPASRRNSKSPYKQHRDLIQEIIAVSPNLDGLEIKRNVSPHSKSQRQRVSPYKTRGDEPEPDHENYVNLYRKQNSRTPPKYLDVKPVKAEELTRVSERSNYSHRSMTAPRPRPTTALSRTPSPLPRNLGKTPNKTHHIKAPSASEINEMIGMVNLSKAPNGAINNDLESNSLGSVFFSREYATFAAHQKNVLAKKNEVRGQALPSRPEVIPERVTESNLKTRVQTPYIPKTHIAPITKSGSRTSSSSTVSRQSTSKYSTESSVRSSDSLRKFTANRKKVQKDTWFNCMSKGPCKLSKSPERRDLDEASFIGKAFVVESLREFWTEKHRPSSLSGFNCHKHQAQLLKQLTSRNSFPHILLKGPPGSGKKALTMAILHEIFGDPAWDISHELRRFQCQENRAVEVAVPVTSSPHHVELDLEKESKNARYALMALVKEMTSNILTPDISTISFRADYKVIVLYAVDKAAENAQHLIKWIMDCYSDSCKLILCCEDDVEILDSVKTRCEVVKVDAPVTHEIMEVLIQIARKENFDLPMSFAAKIATKSKQNLRKAIMALEACKAHNYPFLPEQPIPFGWEEVLVDLAAEILADPSPKRLFYTRGKFQKLLVDFVHPKLILLKLVEQFLKGVETSLKRELYYWHSYYDKRLPVGTSALLKLEEFVAKFMSIYRKSFTAGPSP